MILYHGTGDPDLRVKKHVLSRYGFPALFCTSHLALAELYALFYKSHDYRYGKEGGYIYEIHIDAVLNYGLDYGGKISYSKEFRQLVYDLHKDKKPIAIIKNCLDFPTWKLRYNKPTDIIIIFDFAVITKIKLKQEP